MLRTIAAAVIAFAAVALAGCGHRQAAGTSPDSATLAAYVMNGSTPASRVQGRTGQQAGPAAAVCTSGQDAYRVLVFLVSADTGTSVQEIARELGMGRTLDDVAGARSGDVAAQAVALVQAWLQFAVANGRLTAEQADQYRAVASVAIDALMAADVSSCIPATQSLRG